MVEPMRRGDGLRVLTDFTLNDIYPLLFDQIKRGTHDTSPYVRKIAFSGILKVKHTLL